MGIKTDGATDTRRNKPTPKTVEIVIQTILHSSLLNQHDSPMHRWLSIDVFNDNFYKIKKDVFRQSS